MDTEAVWCIAQRIADERFCADFYDLSDPRRAEVWREAEILYNSCMDEHNREMEKAAKVRK